MFKVTKRGIEELGEPTELSEEDREFIEEMFKEFSDYQKPHLYQEEEEE